MDTSGPGPISMLLLFDGKKIKMERKRGMKQKEIPVECTGESEGLK